MHVVLCLGKCCTFITPYYLTVLHTPRVRTSADELAMHVVLCLGKQEICKTCTLTVDDTVDSIGLIVEQRRCYHDLNHSKTVVQMKLKNILWWSNVIYHSNCTTRDFLFFFYEHGTHWLKKNAAQLVERFGKGVIMDCNVRCKPK